MKKYTKAKICTSVLAISTLALSCTSGAFAAANYLKLGTEDIYTSSAQKSNAAGTATYSASIKTLTLKNYTGANITTNIPNLKVVCAGSSKAVFTTGTSTSAVLSAPETIPANICGEKKEETVKNPETLDPIYYYFALLAVSSILLISRRHFAKH